MKATTITLNTTSKTSNQRTRNRTRSLSRNSQTSTNNPRRRGTAKRRPQLVPCWLRSLSDPFSAGPCKIPDIDTRPSIAATSRISTNSTIAANAGGPVTGLSFICNPFLLSGNTAGQLYDVAGAGFGTFVPQVTAIGWFNNGSLLPNNTAGRNESTFARCTAMGIKVWGTATNGQAVRIGIGQLPCRELHSGSVWTTESVYVGSTVTPDDPGFFSRYREVEYTDQAFELAEMWVPRGVPEYYCPWSASAVNNPDNLFSLSTPQDAFFVAAYGPSGVKINFEVIAHWEIIPGNPFAFFSNPTRSSYDSRAVETTLNVLARIPVQLQARKVHAYNANNTSHSTWETLKSSFSAMTPEQVTTMLQYASSAARLLGYPASRAGYHIEDVD